MLSKDEQLGRRIRGRTANILIITLSVAVYFDVVTSTRKSPRVFFEGYLFGGGAGMFATCIFKHLDSVN